MYMLCSLVLFDPLPPHPLTQLISHCVDPGSATLQQNAISVSQCPSMGRGKFPPGVLAAVRPSPESDLVPSLGSLAAVRQSPARIIALCLSADRFARLSTFKFTIL